MYVSKSGPCVVLNNCFWCGEGKEIYLISSKKVCDKIDNRRAILNYEPCDNCKEKFKQGILVIEADSKPRIEDHKSISEGAYPTGRYVLMKEEAFIRIFEPSDEDMPVNYKQRAALLLPREFELIFGEYINEK